MSVPLACKESHFSMQSLVAVFNFFIVLGGWIFVRCFVNDTPDVFNGIEISRVHWPAVLGYKVWQIPLKCESVANPE